jgi:hypothetical protein
MVPTMSAERGNDEPKFREVIANHSLVFFGDLNGERDVLQNKLLAWDDMHIIQVFLT